MESWSLSNLKRDVSVCECSGTNIKLSQCQRDISRHVQAYGLKAGFHMIADRRSQIAIRSAIVCDHMETYFCDRLRSCDRDRRRSQKIEPCSIFCDRLRSPAINCHCAIIWKSNKSFAIRDRNASHNISGSLPRFNARVFDGRNGLRSDNHFVVISRNLWRKLLVMNVFTIAAEKILKTRTKRPTVGTKSGRSFIYRPGKRRPNFAT